MSARPTLPLTEPQERHITVALASLEKQLAQLRQRLRRRARHSRLVRYADPISADEAARLLPVVIEAESRLRRIADDLGLEAQSEPVRGAIIAGLELASIDLYQCRADSGLSGYGAVAPATANYLEREIPKLDEVIQLLLHRVRHREGSG
jgi:hypothetical protein